MPTTRALLDRLETDSALRRICGWERKNDVPDEWTFSRAFAEFSKSQTKRKVVAGFKKSMRILFDGLLGQWNYVATPKNEH